MKKLFTLLIFITFIAITSTAIAAPISPLNTPSTENLMMLFIGVGLIGVGTFFRKATDN